ncbi:hypothetical protein J2S41_003088 [Catenuloplanes atrovinosus]|uniref:Secreted protein n=2 Tax=Catenuloplanes atrovinosus TaxID=137266 RepID=A0AAE3YPL3_9ACTN|nr:hypothetical protein [Catenuloplanes atrovinosus]
MSPQRNRRRSVLLSAAAVACAAATITVASATPASAATGVLILRHSDPAGNITYLANPAPGCYSVRDGYNVADNRLNTYVLAYRSTFCNGSAIRIEPGTAPSLWQTAYSVQVPS